MAEQSAHTRRRTRAERERERERERRENSVAIAMAALLLSWTPASCRMDGWMESDEFSVGFQSFPS
jgi:hypothetical protein